MFQVLISTTGLEKCRSNEGSEPPAFALKDGSPNSFATSSVSIIGVPVTDKEWAVKAKVNREA